MAEYNAREVNVDIDGTLARDVGDGIFVTTRRDNVGIEMIQGAKGEVGIAKVANNVGTIEITLKHTSPTNAVLGELARSKSSFAISVVDGNNRGKVVAGGSEAYVEREADNSRGNTIETRTWTIKVADFSEDNQ